MQVVAPLLFVPFRSLKTGVTHTCHRGVTQTPPIGVTHTCFEALKRHTRRINEEHLETSLAPVNEQIGRQKGLIVGSFSSIFILFNDGNRRIKENCVILWAKQEIYDNK